MIRRLIILLLIVGCAGVIVSPENTWSKITFDNSNASQDKLFDMCIEWAVNPDLNMTIDTKDKDKRIITGTGMFNSVAASGTINFMLTSWEHIQYKFKIEITGIQVSITYSDYMFYDVMTDTSSPFKSNYLQETTAYTKLWAKELEKYIKNNIASNPL